MRELLIIEIRFVICQYRDGIIEIDELLTKIEELLNG
jgi:hypothetical protein